MYTVPELFSSNLEKEYYTPDRLLEWLDDIGSLPFCKKRNAEYYSNFPASFDIETTSTYMDDDKVAFMYEWTFNICGINMIGRSWDDFRIVYEAIVSHFKLNRDRILIVYVHNLAFEFQFIRKRFDWLNVFALDMREPVKALTVEGVEFRCSYKLSGYSLSKLHTLLTRFDVKKAIGDLDYSKVRHSTTPLTHEEINYCIQDCNVVSAYIMEEIVRNGNRIVNIPLTKTGYVRRFCRKQCTESGSHRAYANKTYSRYRDLMKKLTLEPDEYKQLKRAFAGGFTHCSAWYSDEVMEDVTSYDFTSSYPAVLLSEMFPMSKATIIQHLTPELFKYSIKYFCCLFDLHLTGVKSTNRYEHIISESKCYRISGQVVDNGRVVSADEIYITVTDVDYKLIRAYYKWDHMQVANFRRYSRGYLPKNFLLSILKLYNDKTELKGVDGREDDYLNSKEQLNGCYGMMVTDICRPEYSYRTRYRVIGNPMYRVVHSHYRPDPISCIWKKRSADINRAIKDYNDSKSRFLFYPWGVWCTAYARRNLIQYGIYPCGSDYVYSDTDSVKILNVANHKEVFDRYNELIHNKLTRMCQKLGIDPALLSPKTIKGVAKPIGVWDFDGYYNRFKSLGSKRYMVLYPDGELSLTVSGLNKKITVPYLLDKYNVPYHIDDRGGTKHYIADGDVTEIFNGFTDDLYIPADYTGKNTHTYIDEPMHGMIKDYTGIIGEYSERSGVHLESSDYSLSISRIYANYILGVKFNNK